MHDLDLPTYLMRAWPIISARTRTATDADNTPALERVESKFTEIGQVQLTQPAA